MKAILPFALLFALAGGAQAASDPLRAALEESKASGKGLSFLVNGQTVSGVVVSVDDQHVVARSQSQGTVVIRLERIDGVAGFVGLGSGERKGQ